MICQTYQNTNHILIHDPLGSCGSISDINPITFQLSNTVYPFGRKICEYNQLVKLRPHNCSIVMNLGGTQCRPKTLNQEILCQIPLYKIIYHGIQLFLTPIDITIPYSVELYFSNNIESLGNDFFDHIQCKVISGMIGIIN